MFLDVIKAAFLGIVEGLTEYIPVSSTGHLLLLQHFFGFSDEDFGNTFAVLIQLGAILALLSIYFSRLLGIAVGMFSDPAARRFVIGVLVGLDLKPTHYDATKFTLPMYLGIGLCQCLAMVPGVSRSGATIISAMLLGANRRSAAEFSFYLAMPTMIGAFALDFYKNAGHLGGSNLVMIAIGFITSFVAGWIVVKRLLDYVSERGFDLFAWWRVVIGTLGLIGLALIG
jgi:undecaprenyl-diphosphatase